MRQRGILTRDQVELLLSACGDSYSGRRDAALLAVCYRTGLRPGEALGLDFSSFRAENGTFRVRVERPKGWQRADHPTPPREIGLDDRCANTFRAWLEARGAKPGPLFTNRKGGRVSGRYWRAQVAKLGRRAGLEGRVHPHGLRHSFAHDAFRETRDPILVQKALGHSDLKTSLIYLSQIGSSEEVVEFTTNRRW